MAQVLLRAAHSSGQFSDTEAQQRVDAKRLTKQMVERRWRWLTGTEAGSKSVLDAAFLGIDDQHGLKFHKAKTGDVWVMHRKDLFKGEVDEGWYKVVDGVAGQFSDRGIFRLTGESPLVGADLTILVAHYNTKGRPVADKKFRRWLASNKRIADKAGELAREYGAKRHLVFYGGDQNIPDDRFDTFLGNPLTSLADELHDPQNTGHGSIDVMASYDGDKRIKGTTFRVLDDREFALNTDHFLCEGSWTARV